MAESNLKRVYARLLEVRAQEEIKLRQSKYLRATYQALDGEEYALKIRNYQAQGILHLNVMSRFVLADDTGLGKSLTSLASICFLAERDPHLKVMIVATSSTAAQWKEEIERFCGEDAFSVYMAKKTPKSRMTAYKAWAEDPGRAIVITRYGAVRNDVSKMQEYEGYTLITDEAAEYNNPDTRIYQAIKLLSRKASRMWALTATPIQNHLIEGYGIFSVVVPGLFPPAKAGFIKEYCMTRLQAIGGGRKIPVIVGYKRGMIQVFRDKIDPFFLARSKSQVAKELPPVLIIKIPIKMSAAQEALYTEALLSAEDDTVVDLDDFDVFASRSDAPQEQEEKKSKLAILTACQQIANHPALVEAEGESAKLKKLFEIIDEGEIKGEKVLIFSRFRTMVDILEKECERRGIGCVRITGSETQDQRVDARKRFTDTDSGIRVCFVTRAGGVGLNLQAAKAIIFYDTPWSAGIYEQLVGRINRIGSAHDRTFAIHLVCRNSIDETVLRTLAQKLKLIDQIVGDRLSMEDVGTDMSMSEINVLFEAEMGRRRKARSAKRKKS